MHYGSTRDNAGNIGKSPSNSGSYTQNDGHYSSKVTSKSSVTNDKGNVASNIDSASNANNCSTVRANSGLSSMKGNLGICYA